MAGIRGVRLTTKSESSDFLNILNVFDGDGNLNLLFEVPGSSLDLLVDPTSAISAFALTADGIGPLAAARVQLWIDSDQNGLLNPALDTPVEVSPGVFDQLVTDLTWNEVVDAASNGGKDVFIAIDDDGNSSDGDFNDIVVEVDVECPIQDVVFSSVAEDSGYFNQFVATGKDGSGATVPETPFGVQHEVHFDASDASPGSFKLDTGHDSALARVKVFVDDGDKLFEPGAGAGRDGDAVFEKKVGDLTWSDLAGASGNGKHDLFLAFDDDGANIDEDFNDIVVLADFVTKATFTFMSQESGYDNALQIGGSALITENIGSSATVNIGEPDATDFELLTGVLGSETRVKLFWDKNNDGTVDAGDELSGGVKFVDDLTWADLLTASADGERSLLMAFDDGGAGVDADFNDIVVRFTIDACDCGCGEEEQALHLLTTEPGIA